MKFFQIKEEKRMFEYLKKYVVENENQDSNKKHVFYKVKKEDVEAAELNMDIKFPEEIVLFFDEIGYGYFYDKDECFTDVLMKPQDIADFRCGEGNYFYSEEREFLKSEDLVFFEVDSNCHIYIKLCGENKGNVYLGSKKIAESFKHFIQKISEKSNYFFKI